MQTKTIQANGLQFAYYEQGDGDRLALCFHGFPDTADTWRDLMPVLADAGYRVVAPFMRGYPPTQIPASGDYSAKALAEDAIALIDALGAENAVLIGQDWGALLGYAAAALNPDRISRLVTVAIPHPRALGFGPATLWQARHFITFQFRRSSVRWMQRNNFAALHTIYKRWSPTWPFSDADLAPVRESLSQPGAVEAALGYYWSFFAARNDAEVQKLLRRKTDVPTLTVLGDKDGGLPVKSLQTPKGAARLEAAYTGRYEQVIMPGVGHFLHREAADDFAEVVMGFLNS